MQCVLVLLAEGSEELEAVTVIDILRRSGARVVVAGLSPGPLTLSRGVRLLPDVQLDEVMETEFQLVVVPGGASGAARLREDERVLAVVRRVYERGGLAAAICAGPSVLHRAGLLLGKRVTSYPGALPAGEAVDERVVVDGRIITSRGPGTVVDFALALVEALHGYSARRKVEDPLLR